MNTEEFCQKQLRENWNYLTKNLCNITVTLNHFYAKGIIEDEESDFIASKPTDVEKCTTLFKILQKKDFEKNMLLDIFKKTGNGHLSDRLKSSNNSAIEEKPKISKFWPYRQESVGSFYERNDDNGNNLVKALHKTLISNKNSTTVISQHVTVAGLGGIGKTCIAIRFAEKYEANYNHILWFNCGDGYLTKTFHSLAVFLKVNESQPLNMISNDIFEKLGLYKCLIIFDNAECYVGDEGIKCVLPRKEIRKNFHVIITSRYQQWGEETGLGKIILFKMGGFKENESIAFLNSNLKTSNQNTCDIQQLCKLLGNLPLALHIAVAAMNANHISVGDYITQIKDSDANIHTSLDSYEKTIFKALTVSWNKIENVYMGQQSLNILRIFGYVQPDNVPMEFFFEVEKKEGKLTKWTKHEMVTAVKTLEDYSLITVERKSGDILLLNVHRLLQQVVRYNSKSHAMELCTLRKIMNVDGYLDYKLIPLTYAKVHNELKLEFSDLESTLIDNVQLEGLVYDGKFAEAVTLAELIHKKFNSTTSKFNVAVCHGYDMKTEDSMSVFYDIFNSSQKLRFSDTFGLKNSGEIELKIINQDEIPNTLVIATMYIFKANQTTLRKQELLQKLLSQLQNYIDQYDLDKNIDGRSVILNNFVFLAENLKNIHEVLNLLLKNGIITRYEQELVQMCPTSFEQNTNLFMVLQKKSNNYMTVLENIFLQTYNDHIVSRLNSHTTNSKPVVLSFKWWPNDEDDSAWVPTGLKSYNFVPSFSDASDFDRIFQILKSTILHRIIIAGSTSSGKRTAACKFAKHVESHYDHIFSLDFNSLQLIILQKLAHSLCVKNYYVSVETFDLMNKILKTLSHLKCLFLLHGVELKAHEHILRLFTESEKFHSVLTTCDDNWLNSKTDSVFVLQSLNQNNFDEIKSKSSHASKLTNKEWDDLFKMLYYFPWAIQIAMATLDAFKMSHFSYMQSLHNWNAENMKCVTQEQKALQKCLDVLLNLLQMRSKSDTAFHKMLEILKICSYVSSSDIDLSFLEQCNDNKDNFRHSVEQLQKLCLIKLRKDFSGNEVLRINPVVKKVVKEHFKSEESDTLCKILETNGYHEYKFSAYSDYSENHVDLKFQFGHITAQNHFYVSMLREYQKMNYKQAAEFSSKLHKICSSDTQLQYSYNNALCTIQRKMFEESIKILESIFEETRFTQIPRNVLKKGYSFDKNGELAFHLQQPDEVPVKFVVGVNCLLLCLRNSNFEKALEFLEKIYEGCEMSMRSLEQIELFKFICILLDISIKIGDHFLNKEDDAAALKTMKTISLILNVFNSLVSKPNLLLNC